MRCETREVCVWISGNKYGVSPPVCCCHQTENGGRHGAGEMPTRHQCEALGAGSSVV